MTLYLVEAVSVHLPNNTRHRLCQGSCQMLVISFLSRVGMIHSSCRLISLLVPRVVHFHWEPFKEWAAPGYLPRGSKVHRDSGYVLGIVAENSKCLSVWKYNYDSVPQPGCLYHVLTEPHLVWTPHKPDTLIVNRKTWERVRGGAGILDYNFT